ncbi:MAG: N-acetylmuramoyl-L-alanine amidase [Candidatus Paceibacterota bacterium]
MTTNKKIILIVSLALFFSTLLVQGGLSGSFTPPSFLVAAERLLANFLFGTVTTESILDKHQTGRVRILLVPGHDNEYTGARFGHLREADANLLLAEKIYADLSLWPGVEVLSARNFTDGEYSLWLANYFTTEAEAIRQFMTERRQAMQAMLGDGTVETNVDINHNFALDKVAFRLYGINKWANENDVDILLHLHLNDYAVRRHGTPGIYSGFSIYIPERQFPNADASRDLAEAIREQLAAYWPASDYPKEAATIIEAQELIALGSNASQRSASVLVEYGYIYEPQFTNPAVSQVVYPLLVQLTKQGITAYLAGQTEIGSEKILPAVLSLGNLAETLEVGERYNKDVAVLQLALRGDGLYPPAGETFNDCPITGNFGSCTRRAVVAFQEKYRQEVLDPLGLSVGTGIVGQSTWNKLTEIYR